MGDGVAKAALIVAFFLLSGVAGAAAQSLTLTPPNRWVVVASRPEQIDAVDLARNYSREINAVRVVRSFNGLHAVIFGPVAVKSIAEVTANLSGRFYMPGDAFLAKGDKFVDLEFEASPSPVLAYARYDGGAPTFVRYGVSLVTLSNAKDRDGFSFSVLRLKTEGSDTPTIRVDGVTSTMPWAHVEFVRLDPKAGEPQVVFSSFSGGAHCCTSTRIVTLTAGHSWQVVDAGSIDGEGYSFEDIGGDGAAELISVDNSFLYKFESYAGSYAPPRVHRLVGSDISNVTRDPSIRPLIQRALRQLEFAANSSPNLWSNNGFLGGWVGTKALLGEVDDAWRRMLTTYDRNPMFFDEACMIAVKIEQCPADQKRRLPFPDALRKHLLTNGYPVPSGITPTPVVAKENPPSSSAGSSSGSSFFITGEGHLLTNAHVVNGCARITVSYGAGETRTGRLIAHDETNDLAIIKIDTTQKAVAAFRSGVRVGEEVAVYGFPLFGLLASGGNFTLGNVTALAGLRDDSRMLQISAPVQPGNSGGPLLDESGAIVGIVVSKLNAIKLALATADLAQNINFAIKANTAQSFIEAQGLTVREAPKDGQALRPADLADLAKSVTALVECQR
jgi:S1-C subfamily serine protease